MSDKVLTIADFENRVNETFTLEIDEADHIQFCLKVCKPLLSTTYPGKVREAFSLIFEGPKDINVPQHTYKLNNTNLGEVSIFIVPIGDGENGKLYQAVFN